jgi:formylglycine-generating enzyme required for sulfatase activity
MSQCLNPSCLQQNPDDHKFCSYCRTQLLLGDRYRAVNYIGEGAFGRTFLAVDQQRLNSPCVIKQFLPLSQGKAFELFKQEAQLLMNLGKNPQIPDLLAFFEQETRFYLIQEYVEGQDLQKILIQKKYFTETEVIDFLNQLLPVLQFIHDHKVIHRDIKLDNIILKSSPSNTPPFFRGAGGDQMVLIDFGVSKQLSTTIMTKIGTVAGTPGYASPEQMRGLVNETSDLYALAVCAIRMLTGCLPEEKNGTIVDEIFNLAELEWVWEEILQEKGLTVSDHLRSVLNKMLEDKIKDRFQSATEVLQALQNNSSGTGFQPVEESNTGKMPVIQSNTGKMPVLQSFTFETIKTNNKGQIIKRENKTAQYYREILPQNVPLDMVYIPGGTFMMGSNEYDSEKPIHQVRVKPFFMGKYAVTQGQYQAIMGTNPSYFKNGDDYPVECVSWYDGVNFCNKLSEITGKSYNLPSEAQWEYACRAGTSTPFAFGETVTPDLVNYDGDYPYGKAPKGKYRKTTVSVDYFAPNGFGLYNMHGNVWEWCRDDWVGNYENTPTDGSPYLVSFKNDSNKALRGASWVSLGSNCRSSNRNNYSPDDHDYAFGFRVVVSSGL